MTHPLSGGIAVITGAASGFGLEASRIAARLGMKVVMADVQAQALEAAAAEIRALGASVLAHRVDVSQAADVQALADATVSRFGVPNFVFNNAGVATGGLLWEHSAKDWDWVLGVNLMGVVYGLRIFTPLMLQAARADAAWRGHIVNTASMAGLVNMPNSSIYNVSKFGVVALSESLYQDLALVTDQLHAHVLCPFYVATGIFDSARHRPAALTDAAATPTRSQQVALATGQKATSSGKVSAAQVAQFVFDAVAENRFYVFSHPHALGAVALRADDIVNGRNPSDPFAERPHKGAELRAALRDDG